MRQKTCQRCGRIFFTNNIHQKYCEAQCRKEAIRVYMLKYNKAVREEKDAKLKLSALWEQWEIEKEPKLKFSKFVLEKAPPRKKILNYY